MGVGPLDFSLHIEATGSHVPHKGLVQGHATFMPGAAHAGSHWTRPGLTTRPGLDTLPEVVEKLFRIRLALAANDEVIGVTYDRPRSLSTPPYFFSNHEVAGRFIHFVSLKSPYLTRFASAPFP